MTRYEIRKLQRSPTTGNFTAVNRTSLLMQRRSTDSSLYELLQQGTLTYLLQAMAVKG
jgi:hypothetical protein